MLKKQLINKKELSILTENPIILLYHFSNVSTKNWQFLKKKIQKVEDINNLIIQNNIGNFLIKETIRLRFLQKGEKNIKVDSFLEKNIRINLSNEIQSFFSTKKDYLVPNLFQGPTFIVGCKTKEQLIVIYNLLKDSSNFIFIGGWYNYQKISHLTIKKIIKVNDEKIHKKNLIQFFEKQKLFILIVKKHLIFTCYNLLQIFKILKKMDSQRS